MTNLKDAKIRVTEVNDGLIYQGSISIGESVIDCSLRFARHLQELDEVHDLTPEQLYSNFLVEARYKGRQIFIDGEEKGFFLGTAGMVAIDMFHSPQRADLRLSRAPCCDLAYVTDLWLQKAHGGDPSAKATYSLEKTIKVDVDNPVISGLLNKTK